jgi:hypothetical protein
LETPIIRKYKPPDSLKEQYEKYKKFYNYSEVPDFGHALELYTAKLWLDWIEAGNDPGDSLRLIELDGQPLSYWIAKYKEIRK